MIHKVLRSGTPGSCTDYNINSTSDYTHTRTHLSRLTQLWCDDDNYYI